MFSRQVGGVRRGRDGGGGGADSGRSIAPRLLPLPRQCPQRPHQKAGEEAQACIQRQGFPHEPTRAAADACSRALRQARPDVKHLTLYFDC